MAAGQTTVTATVVDPAGNLATSGTVTFIIVPQSEAVAFRIAGSNLIAPQVTVGAISPSGQLLNSTLSGPLLIWGNPQILPANTTYRIDVAPNNVLASSINGVLIFGASYDLSNIQFAPITDMVPQQVGVVASPFSSNIIPAAGHVFNIGSQQLPYANLFVDTLTVGGGPSIGAVDVQQSYPGATVTVYLAGTSTLATIYADRTGTALANPFTANAVNSSWGFYAQPGYYDVQFSGTGISTPFKLTDLQIPPLPVFVNVKDTPFNAKGDGSTDDTVAIQAALNAISPAGGTVYLPGSSTSIPATYIISSQLTVPAGVNLEGSGRAGSVIKAAASFTATSGLLVNSNCTIRSFGLQGRNVLFSGSFGLGIQFATNAVKILIENMEIFQWDNSGINGGSGCIDCIIRGNWVHDNLNEGIFVPQNSNYFHLLDNYVFNNGFNGIDVNGSSAIISKNKVYNNGFTPATSPPAPQDRSGIFIYPISTAVNHQIEGNLVYGNYQHGIVLFIGFTGTNVQFNRIVDNTIYSNGNATYGGDGINVHGQASVGTLSDQLLQDNICYLNQGYGINIDDPSCTRIIAKHNYLYNNTGGTFHDLGTGTVNVGNLSQASTIENFTPGITVGLASVGAANIAGILKLSTTLTPAAIPAASVFYQNFTLIGLQIAHDTILKVTVQPDNNLALVEWRCGGDNNLELGWVNPTAGALTPTAGRTYTVWVFREQ